MNISINKQDVLGFLKYSNTAFNLNMDKNIVMFDQCINITNCLSIKKTLPVGSISMDLYLAAVDGCIELNIKNAQLFGVNWFGVLRQKAGEILLTTLNPYQSKIKSWKADNGNIRLQIPNIQIKNINCSNGILVLEGIVQTNIE